MQVVNQVRAEFELDRRDLAIGDAVHQDEVIQVGAESVGEIVLEDQTKLALGPGSRLLLDKFVYNGQKSSGDIVLNLVKGTFRFVTGVATKNSYRIRTPAVSVTVRGTIFDAYIAEDQSIWLLLMEGAIRACNDQGACRLLDRPGQILRVSPRGDLSAPARWAQLPGRDSVPFDTAFPFVASAPGIDPNPALTKDAIISGSVPPPRPKNKRAEVSPPPAPSDGTSLPPTVKQSDGGRGRASRAKETYLGPQRRIGAEDVAGAISLGLDIARGIRKGRIQDYGEPKRGRPGGSILIDGARFPRPQIKFPGNGGKGGDWRRSPG